MQLGVQDLLADDVVAGLQHVFQTLELLFVASQHSGHLLHDKACGAPCLDIAKGGKEQHAAVLRILEALL